MDEWLLILLWSSILSEKNWKNDEWRNGIFNLDGGKVASIPSPAWEKNINIFINAVLMVTLSTGPLEAFIFSRI